MAKFYDSDAWKALVERSKNPVKYKDPERCPTCGWAIKTHTSRQLRACRKDRT